MRTLKVTIVSCASITARTTLTLEAGLALLPASPARPWGPLGFAQGERCRTQRRAPHVPTPPHGPSSRRLIPTPAFACGVRARTAVPTHSYPVHRVHFRSFVARLAIVSCSQRGHGTVESSTLLRTLRRARLRAISESWRVHIPAGQCISQSYAGVWRGDVGVSQCQ